MDVAIIGIGCRFPGAATSPDGYWRLLCDGVDAITEIPPGRFDVDAVFDPDPAAPGKIYSRLGGFVDDIDRFDADFFGISPREAKRMDPQHRLLLEVCWEALEDGGQVPERLAGSDTGVFVGISTHDYADLHMAPGQRPALDAHVNIGNALCAAPNRLSYLFDLRGPSLAVETACSSSLTALHLARRSLIAGECSMAIVGGVNLVLSPDLTIGFCKASMISPDGRCRAFDAHANGYVRSEGAGVVVLKPLDRALADADPVYAVVRGSAINEDGRTTGISLPSAAAQERLLRQALRDAGADPSDLQYVEAHGTGTAAGDPVEAAAIGRVFGPGRCPDDALIIGSAKTNLGHLEAAAGMAGLVKVALMLRHRQIPATLHFEQPNPNIPFEQLRLRVPTVLDAWRSTGGPAVAGVNAFGFGGANAHVIVEEPPRRSERGPSEPAPAEQVLTISARTPGALRQLAQRHREHLRHDDAPALHDLCHTAALRRTHHEHRLALVGPDAGVITAGLDAFLAGEESPAVVSGRCTPGRQPRLAFVFPGMGPQWWGMGRQLLADEPVFREAIEECDGALRPVSGWSLLDELTADEADSRISETHVVQVVNCAFQIALARLWRSWGVAPDAVVGHSAGEMAAAHVAGAVGLADALLIAYHRGRLLHRLSGSGAMLAAGVDAAEASALIDGREGQVALAAVNSPSSVTLSGDAEALADIARELERQERFCRLLPTDVPYHSPQVEAVREELLDALAGVSPRSTAIPMVSEVTGALVDGEDLDAGYWWRNIRMPVLFAACVDTLIADGHDLFCEISPHPALGAYVNESLAHHDARGSVVPSLRRNEDERQTLLRAVAALHVRGRVIDWAAVVPQGSCVPLPPYPWQRERYWLDEPRTTGAHSGGTDTGHPLLGRRLPAARPLWETDLADRRLDYLEAHVVDGSVVFPGAGYVEMALAAARRNGGDAPVTLEDVEFRALLFPGQGRDVALQLVWHPHDDTVEVHSARGADEPAWTLHASARLSSGPGPGTVLAPERADLAALRDRCADQVAVDDYYEVLEAYGFRYGAPFRGLEQVWAGEAEALARVAFPSDATLPTHAYEVHPALLDAAFQLLVAAAGTPEGDAGGHSGPLFPVAVRRIVFRHSPAGRFWAHATVRRASEAQIEGYVTIIDENGEVAMSCEGLRLDVVDEGRGATAGGETLDDWLYELGWEEAPLEVPEGTGDAAAVDGEGAPRPALPAALVRPATAVARALEARGGPEATPGVAEYHDTVRPVLDRLAAGYTHHALVELGWDGGRDGEPPAEDLAERLGVVPGRRRLLRALLELARPAAPDDAATAAASGHAGTGHDALSRELDALAATAPAFAAEARLLRIGGEALAGVLHGDEDARELLLSGETLALLTRMYHDSPACRTYHTALADAVADAADAAPDGRPLRVLEVGAGTGAATATALPALPPSTEYVVTDISPLFVSAAEARFGSRPHTRFEVLDIERDPRAQGFEPGSFDVVVAADVLHATADLRASLGHVGRLLAPGGLLALLELASGGAWVNLVFGLLDGWWRYTDTDLRPDGPLLAPPQWCDLLDSCGWEQPTPVFAGEGGTRALQALVLAHAPSAVGGRPASGQAPTVGSDTEAADALRWLLLIDEGGVGEGLAATLRQRGDTCTLVTRGGTYRRRADGTIELPPGDAAMIERLLADLREQEDAPDALVHLWSLDVAVGEDAGAEEVLDVQRLGCGTALAIAQALEPGSDEPPAVWLVTAGSQTVDGHVAAPNVAQAPLWGLGRVLMNEHAATRCRLVDLGPEPSAEEVTALAAELAAADGEDEVALRGGRRYVRRFRRAPLGSASTPDEPRPLSPDAASFRLETDEPGTLERLTLREVPSDAPGPGEVAIRVRASGLNFRDVLLALGMLPEAALGPEAQAHVPGVECSGVVVECGEGVEELRPGDEVVALAYGSHGSRVVTRASLTVPKPERVPFAEAASITNAFVTAEYALGHVARLAPGERVLLHSASGAVGLAAIQYCQRLGAEVLATAGTPDKRAYLRSIGVEHVLDSRSLDFADEVRERSGGEGVDVVLNSLSGDAMRASLDLLRPYGRFVELGKRDVYEDTEVGLLPFRRNLTYTAVDLMQLAFDRPDEAKRLLLDAARQVGDGTYTPVPCTVFDLAEAEDAFRLMAQARHIGKVVLTVDEPEYAVCPNRDAPLCRGDGTYLVTGGLGGFGLAVAAWLVGQGARNLVLMSRSGGPQDDGEALAALEASPARVVVVRGDVGREADVSRVLRRIRDQLPPLRGVVHAAMVLDDDVLTRLDEQRFRAVLAPKVAGAWNLHRLTGEDPLDFFVLFSSIASVIGHPMQGNYAAANAFLDALAGHRRGRGLPGLSVGWGAIAEVGYVARRPELARHVKDGGLVGFAPREALDALGALLRRDRPHVVASRIDWERFMDSSPPLRASPRFRSFAPATGDDKKGGVPGRPDGPLASLEQVEPEHRHDVLAAYLVGRVARVLGSEPDRIDPERPLTEMGFDSLMAVELTTAIRSDLKLRIPVVKVLEGSSPRELARIVLDLIPLDGRAGGHESDEAHDGGPGDAGDGDEAPIRAYPLSFEQRRLWFLHRLDPDDPAYNMASAARLSGALDVAALERSVEAAVERHEVLRATFRHTDGEPLQVFAPPNPVPLPVVDLGDLPEGERDQALQRRATAEIGRPFDLEQGPLLRALLFRLAPQDHVLLLLVHHIAADAWSMNWLAREIAALYGSYRGGEQPALPPPSFRYVDYVRRERERIDDGLVETQLAYWTRTLAGTSPALRLPGAALERGQATSIRGGHRPFALPAELVAALERLSRAEQSTLFMTLLAGFQALLHRYSGQEDLCVATPVTTRDPEAEAVVGCFMNTVVLRGDLSGDPTFRELLRRTRTRTLEAFTHRDVPFERVVDAVRSEHGTGGTPLFDAMLVLHSARLPELRVAGLDLRPVDVESGTAVTDLTLLLDAGEQLRGVVEYNADRFDAATVERMIAHFRTLLERGTADPDRRLSELSLLDAGERQRVLVEWNDTAVDLGPPRCLHELVEAQVRRTPEAVAVLSGATTLTYAELDSRANLLAHRLRVRGVGADAVVAVCLPRSPDAVVALLAVLKAGGAFLPLDPEHPPQRLGLQVADAQVTAVLTLERMRAAFHKATTLAVDGDAFTGSGSWPVDPPASGVDASNLAYVIHTSGSTGRPRGVMIEHRAVCNHLRWRQRTLPLDATDAVLQRTPLTFDPSVWEVFGTLSAGARLVLPDPDADGDAEALVRLIAEQQVTVVQAVPSMLDVLLDEPGLERCAALRRVICGGEPLTHELADRFRARLPAELHHVYGPTEATIEATHWRVEPRSAGPGRAVPIGRPIANVTVRVLDRHLQLVPAGVPGELCIGGAGLARGYLGQPELTAERFVEDPFDCTPGARLYRTGDTGRCLPDGAIEFLGRTDRQVKVRGVRVEPGEVEVVLAGHPTVREVAVVACERGGTETRGTDRHGMAGGGAALDHHLVAFVVPAEAAASPEELRDHATGALPAPMVPGAFALLETLPRLPNGKVDLERLTREALQADEAAEHVAPRDAVELRLVQLWERLFPGRRVGVTDDFFALGGHSLLAVRAIAQVQDAFGTDLPVSSLIGERTIERLARLVRERSRPPSGSVVVQAHGGRPPFFCVHPVSGTVFCYVELARALGEDRPFHALEAVGLAEGEEPHTRVEDMARDYLEVVRRVQPDGPYLLGGWSMGGMVAFEMARQLEVDGQDVGLLALMDTHPAASASASDAAAGAEALLNAFARELGLAPGAVTLSVEGFWQLDPDRQLAYVLRQVQAANLVPPGVDLAALRRQLRVFTMNLQAMRAYQPRPYEGHVTLIEAGGADGHHDPAAWDPLAGGGLSRQTVPGDHYTMLREPHVAVLARQLSACLDEVELVAS